jgi:uncharacterized membrane protein
VNWWDRLLWQLGFSICHQEPDRLLRFGSHSLFVCSRDTGLFVSFFTVILLASLSRGRKKGGIYWPLILFAAAGIAFFAWDGLSSYLGYRESSNLIRFLSGLAAGSGLAILIAPWMNRLLFGASRCQKLGSRPADLTAVFAGPGLMAALYLIRPEPLFTLAETWLAICVAGTFWALNLLLVSMLFEKRLRGFGFYKALLALLFTAAELGASHGLHRLLLHHGPGTPPLNAPPLPPKSLPGLAPTCLIPGLLWYIYNIDELPGIFWRSRCTPRKKRYG